MHVESSSTAIRNTYKQISAINGKQVHVFQGRKKGKVTLTYENVINTQYSSVVLSINVETSY